LYSEAEDAMQESIMLFFLNIANPVLDTFANLASMIGEESFVIAFVLYIYYNYNKKSGFILFSSTLYSVIAMGILKSIVRAPRPFQVLDSIKGKRVETATGYSFPSGHTTTAASSYTALALIFRKRAFSIICAIAIALVGISRLYLGVHWPNDVFGGLVLGTSISLLAYRPLSSLYDDKDRLMRVTLVVGSVAAAAALILGVLLNLSLVDEVAFTDLMKVLALGGGGFLGFVFETKRVNFSTEGTIGRKIVRFVLGLAGVIIIMALKAVIPSSLAGVGGFLRYGLIGLWATGIFPLIGRGLHLFSDGQ
ncbi:MAG: phosphatase PAP2 family protein, partial [Sphaerochaeta sp.]